MPEQSYIRCAYGYRCDKQGDHGHWESSIEGLRRRRVKRIIVDWEDQPPQDIVEERLKGIFKALRLGFEQMEATLTPPPTAEEMAIAKKVIARIAREQFDDEPEVSQGPGF